MTMAADTRELSSTRESLLRTEAEIQSGRHRLQVQERLVLALRASGRNTTEAERLSDVFRRLLVEWERRRELIAQRVTYLEHRGDGRRPAADRRDAFGT